MTIKSWEDLLSELHIEGKKQLNQNDIDKLNQWCSENIKTGCVNTKMVSIKVMFNNYQALLNPTEPNEQGYTVIHLAAQLGFDRFIDTYLNDNENKPYLNNQSKVGHTPLHLAALYGQTATIQILLKHGADANILNNSQELPLHLVAKKSDVCKNTRAYGYLLQNTSAENLKHLDKTNSPILHYLISFDDPSIINDTLQKNPTLTELTNNQGENFLHRAIIQNKPAIVRHFSKNTDLMKQITENGSTVLHLACRYGTPEIISLIFNSPLPEEFLNSEDEHGNSPLHYLNQRWDKDAPAIQTLITQFNEKGAEDSTYEDQQRPGFG